MKGGGLFPIFMVKTGRKTGALSRGAFLPDVFHLPGTPLKGMLRQISPKSFTREENSAKPAQDAGFAEFSRSMNFFGRFRAPIFR